MARWRVTTYSGVVAVCGAVAACTPTVPVATAPPAPAVQQPQTTLEAEPPGAAPHERKSGIDRSGRSVSGKASYYASSFDGKKMANGERLDAHKDVAASKTLPLGTTAKVINRETGKSATVKITDRGPHVDGRVIDVSPAVANQLDMKKKGVVRVEVKPITVPQSDGTVKTVAAQ